MCVCVSVCPQVGSEELDPDMYRQASDLRARLSEAVRAKGALDAALKAAQKSPRVEDADLLEKVRVSLSLSLSLCVWVWVCVCVSVCAHGVHTY